MVPEPFGAWAYHVEPLLASLPQIKHGNPELQTYCYGDQLYSKLSVDNAVQTALLILRDSTTDRVDVCRWRKLIYDDVEQSLEASRREAEFVAVNARQQDKCACISGFSGRYIAEELAEEGYDVTVKHLDLPHYLMPLEILKTEIGRVEVADDRVKELVNYYINYVRRYVLTSSNLDEAYRRWTYKEAGQLGTPAVMM